MENDLTQKKNKLKEIVQTALYETATELSDQLSNMAEANKAQLHDYGIEKTLNTIGMTNYANVFKIERIKATGDIKKSDMHNTIIDLLNVTNELAKAADPKYQNEAAKFKEEAKNVAEVYTVSPEAIYAMLKLPLPTNSGRYDGHGFFKDFVTTLAVKRAEHLARKVEQAGKNAPYRLIDDLKKARSEATISYAKLMNDAEKIKK